jgi:hypothetical protein
MASPASDPGRSAGGRGQPIFCTGRLSHSIQDRDEIGAAHPLVRVRPAIPLIHQSGATISRRSGFFCGHV